MHDPREADYYIAQSRMNFESAVKFAEIAIKAAFTLNGGAMIALPAFAALFKVNVAAAQGYMWASAIMLSFGLLVAWGVTLCAYLGSSVAEAGSNKMAQAMMNVDRNENLAAAEVFENLRAKLRHGALALAITSILFFIGGALVAGYSLIKFAEST